jgi:hypothetical protein
MGYVLCTLNFLRYISICAIEIDYFISNQKMCNYCFARTKSGKLCKRLATCRRGCEYFCYQHVKQYGGSYSKSTKCKDNIKPCPSMDIKKNTYPCSKRKTIFLNKREFNEFLKYRNLRRALSHPISLKEANSISKSCYKGIGDKISKGNRKVKFV